MHALLATTGSAGDVFPFIALGRWLRGRGHDVSLLAPESFAPLAERNDLQFGALPLNKCNAAVAGGGPLRSLIQPLTRKWRKLGRCSTLVPLLRPTYDAIAQRVNNRTVLVALWPLLGAKLAHERLSVPLATIVLSPAYLRSVHRSPLRPPFCMPAWLPHWAKRLCYRALDRFVLDPMLAGPVNAARDDLQLPRIRRVLDRWCFSPQMLLGLYPEWFAPPQPDAPTALRLTGFLQNDSEDTHALPEAAERFLDSGAPPIVCLAGSAIRDEKRYFAELVNACRRLGRRAVILTRHRSQLPAVVPPEIVWFEYLPLERLLPRSAALIHCGGIGTAARALSAGVPQLVLPLKNDQHENAQRLVELGVARMLSFAKCCEAAVASSLTELLTSPDIRRCCAAAAIRANADRPLERAGSLIESLAPSQAEQAITVAA